MLNNVSTSKMQCHLESACVNEIKQLGLKPISRLRKYLLIICSRIIFYSKLLEKTKPVKVFVSETSVASLRMLRTENDIAEVKNSTTIYRV